MAIFLILGIIILSYAYKLSKFAKKIGKDAEESVEEAKSMMKGMKTTIAPAIAARIVVKGLKNFTKSSKVTVKKSKKK